MKEENLIDDSIEEIERIRSEIAKTSKTWYRKAFEKLILAGLGSIHWVGGLVALLANLGLEQRNVKRERLQLEWLEEHTKKMERLKTAINDIISRLNNLGEDIDERIESEEYLDIVRKAFRAWDEADTEEKRRYVKNLITNAAGIHECSDDVVRLFIDWLNLYHEAHFAIIQQIYQGHGPTRYDIWTAIYGPKLVREDSAEADLFKKLIRDLSTGGVIRQARETTEDGQFLKKKTTGPRIKTATMESAFEDTKQYLLTELGKQFVHYTMTELVPRVGAGKK